MEQIAMLNPNLTKAMMSIIDDEVRTNFEDRLLYFLQLLEQEKATYSGVVGAISNEHSSIFAASQAFSESQIEAAESGEVLYDPAMAEGDVFDVATDADGNAAGITEAMQSAAEGADIFSGEIPIS
jgi:hypothetical protein